MEKLLNKLYSYTSKGIKLGLDNIKMICEDLGNPQNEFKILHIAGTNGKGSVASMLEVVLIEAGYSVGKYTSPHIEKINERIIVNTKMISDRELLKYLEIVEHTIKRINIEATFFEIITAMMFLYFRDKKVDWAVVETGMGGRFDSTNIVLPEISIITNISMDHKDFLGDSIEKIAKEKAGIIKKDRPVFFADKKEEVKKVIKEKTENFYDVINENNYTIVLNKEDIKTEVIIKDKKYIIPLYGKYQGENFLLAFSVLRYLGITENNIQSGIKKLKWLGRFEFIHGKQDIVLDGAHNEDSALKLKENVLSLYQKEDVVLICSILKNKNIEKILEIFSDMTSTVIFLSLEHHNRGLKASELEKYANSMFGKMYCIDDLKEAIEIAKNINKKLIVIAGSLYLLGDLKGSDLLV